MIGMDVLVGFVGGLFDWFTGKIPNWLTFGAMICGLVLGVFNGGLTKAIIGLVFGILIYLPFFAAGCMGGGDVKLMGAIGCFTGAEVVLYTALFGSFFGGAMAVVALIQKKRYIRYGIAIGLGVLTLRVLQWLNWPLPSFY